MTAATIAVGLGALREDNELVYLGMLAYAETFVIKNVKESSEISKKGYESRFYARWLLLNHVKVPYLGAYGIEFMKGDLQKSLIYFIKPHGNIRTICLEKF